MRVPKIALPLAAVPLILAAAPPPLEPDGQWRIDYGAQRCTLWRKFGDSKSGVTLRLEQTEPRGNISVLMSGREICPGNGRRDHQLEFQPLGGVSLHEGISVVTAQEQDNGVYWGRGFSRGKWGLISDDAALQMAKSLPPGKGAGRLISGYKPKPIPWADLDWRGDDRATRDAAGRAFDDRAAKVETIALNPGQRASVTLRTGSLRGPLRVLEKCSVASLKDWGVDPTVDAAIIERAHPTGDPLRVFTANDYPSRAIMAGKESRLHVWLNLDPTGRVTACRVISTFATPEINDTMCKLVVKRQTFVPAKTADGTAVASYYVQSFNFQLAN